MKIIVTGGAGFIGSNLILSALKSGCRVVNIDALTYAGNLDSLAEICTHPFYRFVRHDINDTQFMLELLCLEKPDAILHLAAESHVDRSIDSPADFVMTNVVGTFSLLEAARIYRDQNKLSDDNFRLIHVSSDEVYGSLGETGSFTESTPYSPRSPYSASKASSDHFARAYYHTYDLPVIVTNCSNNYGPRQFPEKLIPLCILKALSDEPIPVYGDGGNIRDWLYVEDHCQALFTVLEKGLPGQTYNIGGECEKTNIFVVREICGILDKLHPLPHNKKHEDNIHFVKDRPGHDKRYAIDATKIKEELGWVPKESFPSGLEKTVRWYLDNMEWVEKIRSGKYRGQRLGLGGKRV